jgi:hypothetical protein
MSAADKLKLDGLSGGGGELGFANISAWADDDIQPITLSSTMDAIGKCQVEVWEEVPQAGVTNTQDWAIGANDLTQGRYSRHDLAPDEHASRTLTPSGTSGEVTLTLDSSTNGWTAADVGRIVGGNGGIAGILSITSTTVATAVVSVAFASTATISAGSWTEYATIFVGGSVSLTSSGLERNNLIFLMLSEAANGNGTIEDAATGKGIVKTGSPTHSTTTAKFGASSLYLAPSNSFRSDASADFDFGAGDFCVEAWIYRVGTSFYFGVSNTSYNGTTGSILIGFDGNLYVASTSYNGWDVFAGVAIGAPSNTWCHLALVRYGTSVKLYLDGTAVQSTTISAGTNMGNSAYCAFAGQWATVYATMYVEDFRITKGAPVYTADFTPPGSFSNIYPVSQYAALLSTDAAQILTTNQADINNMSASNSLNGQTVYYAISTDDRQTWKIAKSTEGARSIVRNNAGTWEYNSNATYASTTWSAATINNVYSALEQAMSVAANQMSSTQMGAAGDGDWPATGGTLDIAMMLYTASAATTPTVESLTVGYDASVRHVRKTHLYEVEIIDVNTVAVRAPSSGGPRNARVYISG